MPKAPGMRLAVLDGHGNVILSWDETRVGVLTLAKLSAQKTERRVIEGRWPFRRTKTVAIEPDLARAFTDAIDDLLLEIARL